jgi:hypothetical protein
MGYIRFITEVTWFAMVFNSACRISAEILWLKLKQSNVIEEESSCVISYDEDNRCYQLKKSYALNINENLPNPPIFL